MAHLRKKQSVSCSSFQVIISLYLISMLSCLSISKAPVSAPKSNPDKGGGVEFASVVLNEIFPVFYAYYDKHALGMVTLISKENATIKDIKLSFFVKQYMDSPKECPAPTELRPGQRKDVAIFALFTNRVLEVTEATKTMADIRLEYSLDGQRYMQATTATMRLLNRNALKLTDVRQLAAFVSANDPAIVSFSKNVLGYIRDKGPETIDTKLLTAMGVFCALDLFGVVYVSGPNPTLGERTSNKDAVFFYQFPRQSLEYKAGDSADLAILYSALLESVGVETAFITAPEGIYVSFALASRPDQARKLFTHVDDLIFRGDKSWVPVDMTQISDGFLKAWQLGAKAWRENAVRNQTGFFPLLEAWHEYEPVQLSGGTEMTLPSKDLITEAFLQQVQQFMDQQSIP
jgi:hypothetical protein